MKRLICILFALASSAAFAKSSVCVLYVDGSTSPVQSQYSCDGADLKNLYQASGMSAALSKSIPYFIDLGYDYAGCTDSAVDGNSNTAATAYSRCIFIKKNASADLSENMRTILTVAQNRAVTCCLSGDSCMINELCCSGLLKNPDGSCP